MRSASFLYQLESEPSPLWGDSFVNLGKVTRTGVPSLPGFVLSAAAIQALYLQPKLRKEIERKIASHDFNKPQFIAGLAHDIRQLLLKSPIPGEWKTTVKPFFDDLEKHLLLKKGAGLRIMVTSSSPEIHPQVAFVKNWDEAVKLLLSTLASAFTVQALHQRTQVGGSIMPQPAAMLFQVHPEAEASGVGQQYDPQHHDEHTIYLTAHYHEAAQAPTSGLDVYRYDRSTMLPLSKQLGRHRWRTSHEGNHAKPAKPTVFVLTEHQQQYLLRLVKRAQSAFDTPHCFHWALIDGQLFITAVSPVHTPTSTAQAPESNLVPMGYGLPLNPGIVSGVARVIKTNKDWERFQQGDIAVLPHAAAVQRENLALAAGFISEVGHATSAEAGLAVSLGVVAIAGIPFAQELLEDGQLITLDGASGAIYEGRVKLPAYLPAPIQTMPVTGTRVSLIVADPLHVTRSVLSGTDGVGLLRGEFLLEMAGVHPEQIMQQGKDEEYGEILEDIVEQAARAAYPYPLRYQLHDVHPGSVAGRALKPDRHEPNPKLGYRGAHRLLLEPELVAVELAALSRVVSHGLGTIELVLPMVRTAKEARAIEQMIQQYWPAETDIPRIWVRCETPALAIAAEELCHNTGIHGVYFDVPALAQFMSGLDDHNYQMAHHVDQTEGSLLDALQYAITTCRLHGMQAVLLAEEDELHATVLEVALHAGATEVAVSQGEVGEVRTLLASIEQRLLIDHALQEQPEAHE